MDLPANSVTSGDADQTGGSCRPANKRTASAVASSSRKKVQVRELFTDSSEENAEEGSYEGEDSKKNIPVRRGRGSSIDVPRMVLRPHVGLDLGEYLDCTICLDKPASPIHSCSNGHIICGICVDKVKKCGICQTALKVSDLAERLSRQLGFKLACRNSGCNEVTAAADMKTHLGKCYFRDASCTELENGACSGTKVPLLKYPKHLQERHKCHAGSEMTLNISLTKLYGRVGGSWSAQILEKDGNTFLLLNHMEGGLIYVWATVLGSMETANKYMFDFNLCKILKGGKKVKASWTIPVVPFHDRPKFLEGLPFYVTISAKMAKEFGCTLGDKLMLLGDTSLEVV